MYVIIEKKEKLSWDFCQYPLLSGALFSAFFFFKGNNFCDFLFDFLDDEAC